MTTTTTAAATAATKILKRLSHPKKTHTLEKSLKINESQIKHSAPTLNQSDHNINSSFKK